MLTLKDFNEQSNVLLTRWNQCVNSSNEIGWSWIKINNDTGYLTTKRFFNNIDNNNNISNVDNIDNNNNNSNIFNKEEIIEESDESVLKSNQTSKTIVIEYDIIYNKSYRVPVLYLNGCYLKQSTTEPLSWDELWSLLPLSCFDKQQLSSTPYITQVEHPILGVPTYQLHPCETNNLMEQILLLKNKIKKTNNNDNDNSTNRDNNDNNNNIKNYLLSWLTIISPMVNIKIPLHLIKEYSNN
ncbi:hypothetical protein DICPUDRAFT_41378 [Dictyostelium purpureum]|uniref:Ubiquitin-like-conjugating enzyme ATG10 n=1 Tax=Dictyostelium purpureum TaxID=5786 RepID=F0ZZY9_DICPU|nr:uncharacterized protein DICPUDRAFT_41378 [Dictyostelium purpureum]EGC30479.1 hypothetical protein DICPUDRAFT_41378 [Dictyostelium purpureum]|eukprot:XP_003292981.1 hypothetical protein DICPUDRAFT_41378 [Dictyostelium purpureum]